MKKILTITFSILMALMFLPVVAFAQSQDQGNQVQNQNRVQTQNQGEDQQLEVVTQEQESLQEGQDEESAGQAKGQPKPINSRSETARRHMSVVAQMVEELLTTQGARGGIGQQVSEVAKEQQQAQETTEDELDKLDARRGWVKRLIGPNYKAIANLNRQLERNQERIQKLEQLEVQMADQTDKAQVEEAIQALVRHNNALQEYLNSEEKTASLLGWFFRMFAK